jgi:hypothetical protein
MIPLILLLAAAKALSAYELGRWNANGYNGRRPKNKLPERENASIMATFPYAPK